MVSLRWLLTIPFILQTVSVVGLVGYLSYRSAKSAIADLVNLSQAATELASGNLEQTIPTSSITEGVGCVSHAPYGFLSLLLGMASTHVNEKISISAIDQVIFYVIFS